MKAGWTKLVLAVWLTANVMSSAFSAGWPVGVGVVVLLGTTALLAYQAGRGDDAWV